MFGRVCGGMGVLKRMGLVATDRDDRPTVDVLIIKCSVEDNGVRL